MFLKFEQLDIDQELQGDYPHLKKNKEAQKRVADAFSEMMKSDLSKKPKSKAWV